MNFELIIKRRKKKNVYITKKKLISYLIIKLFKFFNLYFTKD